MVSSLEVLASRQKWTRRAERDLRYSISRGARSCVVYLEMNMN